MNNRIAQGILALIAGLSINIIGWPGPHGGIQCVYMVLWQPGSENIIKVILIGLVLLGLLSALILHRPLRLVGTLTSVSGLAIFFLLLLTRIYPPVIPVVLITAIPFLGSLVGAIIFACRSNAGKDKVRANK